MTFPLHSGSAQGPASIWSRDHRSLTIGSILAVTIIALQGIAVATMAPLLASDLGGRSLYGWIFTSFILPQIVGTVLAGQEMDRRSPARDFMLHLLLLAIGCAMSAVAPSIHVFFVGRALQGFGAGGVFACVYATVSTIYDDRLRPAMLATISTAFVVPSLVGPAISGLIAEQYSWRFVFLGFLPIIAIIAPLTVPGYRLATRRVDPAAVPDSPNRLVLSVLLAGATGVFLTGPELRPWPLAMVVTVAGLCGLAPALQRLLPEGTFQARPVLPAAIAARGLLFGGFVVVETYMIFSLKEFGGVSAAVAGTALTTGSLTWTTGSLAQPRWDRISGPQGRPFRMNLGLGLALAGTASILGCVIVFQDIWYPVAVAGWMIAALGIGFTYPTAASVAFANAPPGRDGMVASSALLVDLFAFSVGVGLGGAVLAFGEGLGWGPEPSAAAAIGLGVGMIALALLAGIRMSAGYAARPPAPDMASDGGRNAQPPVTGCSSRETGTNPSPGT